MALATRTCMASELVMQGRDAAAQLEALLRGASPPLPDRAQELPAEILRSFDRALAALSSGAADSAAGGRKRKDDFSPAVPIKSRRRGCSAGASGKVEKSKTMQDGFIWRKYGQKEILHCKYPRLYFRCTYKTEQNCNATRQVQRSEEDPSVFVITYFGEHTCSDATAMDAKCQLQPFIIDFGASTTAPSSATGRGGYSPFLPPQRCREEDVKSEVSQGCSPSSPELQAQLQDPRELEESAWMAELMGFGSADALCASPGLQSLSSCLDRDIGESSFDFRDLINFEQIDQFQ